MARPKIALKELASLSVVGLNIGGCGMIEIPLFCGVGDRYSVERMGDRLLN